MSSKIAPSTYDAYANALPDEPYFLLLARDVTAPRRIREWADLRRRHLLEKYGPDISAGSNPSRLDSYKAAMAKCQDADTIAHDMEMWRALNDGAWKTDQPRKTIADIDPAMRDAVHDEVRRSICSLLAVGTAQVVLAEHVINAWSMPGFAVRRHYFRLDSDGKFGRLENMLHPVLPDFHISGHDVALGDVLCKYKSASDVRLEIQIVGAG